MDDTEMGKLKHTLPVCIKTTCQAQESSIDPSNFLFASVLAKGETPVSSEVDGMEKPGKGRMILSVGTLHLAQYDSCGGSEG